MNSPSPSPKHAKRLSKSSSPIRRPLQERSESDTNLAPTIRIVGENGPDIYSKSPFPSKPAHFLPPAKSFRIPFNIGKLKPEDTDENDSGLQVPGRNVSQGDQSIYSDDTTIAATFRASVSSRFSEGTSPTLTNFTLNDDSEDKLSAKLPALSENASTIRLVDNELPVSRPSTASSINLTEQISTPHYSSSPNIQILAHSSSLPPSPNLQLSAKFNINTPSSPPNVEILAHSSSPYQSETDRQSTRSKSNSITARSVNIASPSSVSIAYSDISFQSAIPLPLPSSSHPTNRPRSLSSPPVTSHGQDDDDILPDLHSPHLVKHSSGRSWSSKRMSDSDPEPVWSSRLSTIPSESEPASTLALHSPKLRRERRSIASAAAIAIDSIDEFQHEDSEDSEAVEAVGAIEDEKSFQLGSSSSVPIPAPLFAGLQSAISLPFEGRDSEEREDILGELSTPQIRPKRSGYLARVRSLTRPGSSESIASQISFGGDLAWVSAFYRNGAFPSQHSLYSSAEASASRLNTSWSTTTSAITESPAPEAFPAEIYRPRNRPRLFEVARRITDRFPSIPRSESTRSTIISLDSISPAPPLQPNASDKRDNEKEDAIRSYTPQLSPPNAYRQEQQHQEQQQQQVSKQQYQHRHQHQHQQQQIWTSANNRRPIWASTSINGSKMFVSPRLHQDRKSVQNPLATLSTTSFQDPVVWSPANRQIILFCLGFLIPFSWFVAAFLPLPHQPATILEDGVVGPGTYDQYVGNQGSLVKTLEVDERQYLKAQWWRTLNRIMCIVGVIVIGVIVALVVIAVTKP